MRTWRAAAGMLALCGCSFLGSRGPTVLGPDVKPTCDPDIVPPILDTVLSCRRWSSPRSCSYRTNLTTTATGGPTQATFQLAIGVPALALAALTVSSAIYGYTVTSRCRPARDDYAHRHNSMPPP